MRGDRGALPGRVGCWASHKGTYGCKGSCGGGRLTSALRSSTSMEESSSGSEWICTEAWVDQKAVVQRQWSTGIGGSLEHSRRSLGAPWLRPLPLGVPSRSEPPGALGLGTAGRGRGALAMLRCPQPDVLDVQLLPSSGELDLDGISGDGEGEQGGLRPEARLRMCRCALGV